MLPRRLYHLFTHVVIRGIAVIVGVSELSQEMSAGLQAQEREPYCLAHDVPDIPKKVSCVESTPGVMHT